MTTTFDVPAERRANYAGVRPGKRPERRHAREKDANAKDRFLFVDQDARFFRRLNGAYLYVSIAGLFALYNVVYFLVKVYFVKGPLAFYDMVVPQWVNAAAAFLATSLRDLGLVETAGAWDGQANKASEDSNDGALEALVTFRGTLRKAALEAKDDESKLKLRGSILAESDALRDENDALLDPRAPLGHLSAERVEFLSRIFL